MRIEGDRFVQGRGRVSQHEVLEEYRTEVLLRIGPLARPVRVVVDCGNGTGASPARSSSAPSAPR